MSSKFQSHENYFKEALRNPETIQCFYHVREDSDLEEVNLSDSKRFLLSIDGFKAAPNNRKGSVDLGKRLAGLQGVYFGGSLFQGRLPDKLPEGTKRFDIPVKHVLQDPENGDQLKSLWLVEQSFSYAYYPTVHVILVLANSAHNQRLTAKGFEKLDLKNNDYLCLKNDEQNSEWSVACPSNYVSSLVTCIHIFSLGDFKFRQKYAPQDIKKMNPCFTSNYEDITSFRMDSLIIPQHSQPMMNIVTGINIPSTQPVSVLIDKEKKDNSMEVEASYPSNESTQATLTGNTQASNDINQLGTKWPAP